MRKILVVFILILVCNCQAQQFIERKNFYLVSVLDKYPALRERLPPASKKELAVIGFRFSDIDRQYLDSALGIFYQVNKKQVDQLLDKDIRPSGNYELYKNLTNEELWLKCWSHVRHTTTNFRNATRYIINYGMPTDRPVLFVSTVEQISYSMNTAFDVRNRKELGYLPYKDKIQLSPQEIRLYPVRVCLHRDPTDPLDP